MQFYGWAPPIPEGAPSGAPSASGASGAPINLADGLAGVLSGPQGELIGKGLQLLAAKGVLPGLLGKGGAQPTGLGAGKGPQGLGLGGGGGPCPNAGAMQGATGAAPTPLPAIAQRSGNSGNSGNSFDPFLKEVQGFMERWDLETRFEPKLVSYLKRDGAQPLKEELQRLDRELQQAGVPPVCRSGYLLVVFGEVSEKSTDEDFRYLLTGKKGDGAREDSPSPEKKEKKEETPHAPHAPGQKGEVSAKPKPETRSAPSVAPLSKTWMMEEVDSTCTRFKLDDNVRSRLINAMRTRSSTFKEDMRTLNDVMRAAKHPKGAVQLKLREIERGTFSARSYSPLGPTPAEKQDMERAAKEKKEEKDGEKQESRDRSRGRRRSRSRSRR
mmetsp:Transcript_8891/g.15150  ORF Transcript_8891/g.15150 Transcript_8891/m.15150 type:complete len:384 (-) Transcript_8891:26-1177(-)